MHTTDRFLKFAAECEVMAKFTRSPENKAVWSGLAQRWVRCAELMDRDQATPHRQKPAERRARSAGRNRVH